MEAFTLVGFLADIHRDELAAALETLARRCAARRAYSDLATRL
jgi:hypothetical protein